MEMQGHDIDDDLPQEQVLDQAMELLEHEPNIPPEELLPAEVLMNISSAAYKGCPSDSTISLALHIGHTIAIALADTGSTNTFMDKDFALKHNIDITPTTQRIVKVAGGGVLQSDAVAYNCPFAIQGKKFCTNFRILELQGADIILGVNWFSKHNPVTFEFLGRQLTISV
jgi:hypothetical protein